MTEQHKLPLHFHREKNLWIFWGAFCHETNREYYYDENLAVICVAHNSILNDPCCASKAFWIEKATTGSKMLLNAILLYVLYICSTCIHQK